MFDNIQLWIKITLSMTVSMALVAAILTFSNLYNMKELILMAEQQELRGYMHNISNGIDAETRLGEALSALVANIPLVQKEFSEGDRTGLKDLLLPTYPVLSKSYGVRQFQFHTPPAFSFLRLHKPEKFGDDLSSFRHTVVHTNKTEKATRGLESGVAGLGARGMVPVFYQGKHLGSVEFGMSFGQPFFDAFKKKYGVDVALHIYREKAFTTFASTMTASKPLLSKQQLKWAFEGESQLIHLDIKGVPYAVSGYAVKDYSGDTLGVIEVAMDRRAHQAALAQAKTSALLIAIFTLILGVVVALLFAKSLVRRIQGVIDAVDHIAKGDLTVKINVTGKDEIGQMAQAAAQMQKQLYDIVYKVHEHANSVYSAAHRISTEVGGQAATSSELSSSVTEITSTMEELSASSSQISEYADSVVGIANHTLQSSQQGSMAAQGLRQRMGGIQKDNKNSLHEIMELGSKSKEISKIMDIINVLADQTKLIAFNAALEASSAGEAGHRFGVVASEIRRLADSVTESTNEIESKVTEIQESISRLVISSEKGAQGIEQGIVESGETSEQLAQLVVSADKTSSSAQQISLSTQQQKTASNQVVVALREIVTATNHTKEAIDQISDVSLHMTNLSADLKTLVDQFKVNDSQCGKEQ